MTARDAFRTITIAAGAAAAVAIAGLGLVSTPTSPSAQPAIERHMFFTKPVAASPGYEAHMGAVAIPPGGVIPWHTHHGDEIGYVAEGEVEFELDGEPARKLKAGDAFFAPAGKRHRARNTGNTIVRAVATWVVEKGKPLATPAPE